MELSLTTTIRPRGDNLNSFCAVFLALFTILSFTANSLLIGTIASSYRLRHSVINFILLNLVVVNLIDTAFNMALTLLYVTMCEPEDCRWRLGAIVCQLNSFAGQLVGVETIFTLTLLAMDRAVALLSTARYKLRMTSTRTSVAIAISWLIALSFSLPILTGSIPSNPFELRYFCSVANGAPLAYPISIVVLCYVLPLLVILGAFGTVYHKAHLHRLYRKLDLVHSTDRDRIIDTRRFQDFLSLSKFVVALVIIWLLLQGPYVILNFLEQMANSREILAANNNVRLTLPNASETAITWVKFLYPVILPLLVFSCCRDVWKKLKDLVCCKKTNVINTVIRTDAGLDDNYDEAEVAQNLRVPTLVATTDGLHVEQVKTDADGNVIGEELQFADHPPHHCTPEEQTSDYDSGDESDGADHHTRSGASSGKIRPAKQPKTVIIGGNIQKTQLEVQTYPTWMQKPSPTVSTNQSSNDSLVHKRSESITPLIIKEPVELVLDASTLQPATVAEGDQPPITATRETSETNVDPNDEQRQDISQSSSTETDGKGQSGGEDTTVVTRRKRRRRARNSPTTDLPTSAELRDIKHLPPLKSALPRPPAVDIVGQRDISSAESNDTSSIRELLRRDDNVLLPTAESPARAPHVQLPSMRGYSPLTPDLIQTPHEVDLNPLQNLSDYLQFSAQPNIPNVTSIGYNRHRLAPVQTVAELLAKNRDKNNTQVSGKSQLKSRHLPSPKIPDRSFNDAVPKYSS